MRSILQKAARDIALIAKKRISADKQDRSASSISKSARKTNEVLTEVGAEVRSLRRHVHPGGGKPGGIKQGGSSSVTSGNTFSIDIKMPKQQSTPVRSTEWTDCSMWALMGECVSNPGYMQLHCAAACASIARPAGTPVPTPAENTPLPTLFPSPSGSGSPTARYLKDHLERCKKSGDE